MRIKILKEKKNHGDIYLCFQHLGKVPAQAGRIGRVSYKQTNIVEHQNKRVMRCTECILILLSNGALTGSLLHTLCNNSMGAHT